MKHFWASATATGTFVNSSPSLRSCMFCTDTTEWRELVPRQCKGDCSEIHMLRWGFLCSAVAKSPYISDRRTDLFRFLRKHEHCVSVFVSSLLKPHLPNLRSLFRGRERALRFQVPPHYLLKGCNHTKNALRRIFLVHLVCTFTVLRDLLMICQHRLSRMHACHFESAIGSDNVPNFLK